MPLIHDIQAALLDENASVGAMLLKLRFLAAKLDTDILEEWVRHEADGYPDDVDLPHYRTAHITYTGTFANMVQQLEKQVPAVREIEVGAHPIEMSSDDQKNVEHLTQHIFYGNVTNIHSSGEANSRINLSSTDNSANVAD